MTLLNLDKLPTASLGGVEFLYQSSSSTLGRKTVTHELLNINAGKGGSRYVEDLSNLDDTFVVEAIIDVNKNFTQLNKFIKVLKTQGLQKLVHPIYGNKRVVVKPATRTDDINELGIVRFSIPVEEATANIFPKSAAGSKGFLDRLTDIVSGKGEGNLANAFRVTQNSLNSFTSALDGVKSTSRKLKRIAAIVEGNVDAINDLATSINEIIDDAVELINKPADLATKFGTFFNNLEVAYDRSEDLFKVTTSMFGFSGSSEIITGNSSLQTEKRNNQKALDNYVYTTALGIAYNAAVNTDFSNVRELDGVRNTLEAGFLGLPDDIDRETLQALSDTRIEANVIFDNLSLNLARILTIKTQQIPLTVLTYSLYGNLDNSQNILDLNNIIDPATISGNIEVLSS